MDELLASLETLAREDLGPLFGPALLDRLRPLLVAQNRLAAEVARTVRECEVFGAAEHDGLKTMPSWLRGHGHLSDEQAARVVRAGRGLAHLPGMAAAFAAGAVTAEQAAVLGRIAEPDRLAMAAEQGVDLDVVDQLLTGVATSRPHEDTARAVEHYLDRLDADGPEPDPTEGRRLAIVKHADGSITGRFDLDAVGGEKVQTALESVVQAGRCAADERTRSQQLADALVQLCDNQLASGNLPVLRGHKPQVLVKIGIEDLADPATGRGAADLGFGATISAARARWLACDGAVTRIVMGPDGMPLDYGRGPCAGTRRARSAWWGAQGSFHSPAAALPRSGATCTTCWSGSTAARPTWRTPRCCANGTRTLCAPRVPGGATTRRAMAHLAT